MKSAASSTGASRTRSTAKDGSRDKASPLPADVARRLAEAESHCRARGAQLTPRRREVLELLLLRQGSAKAYDLQDDLRARHQRVAPTTVYRALEFLIEHHLVHRVDTLNTFLVCNGDHSDHHALLLVCSVCERTAELHDPQAYQAVGRRLRDVGGGFRESGIEVKGVCGSCIATQAPLAPG